MHDAKDQAFMGGQVPSI